MMQFSPIDLGEFDHYTLIVDDAQAVADFHVNVLGFRPNRIQLVNAGSVPEGEYDMLNHILWLPGSEERVMVVTEGLTKESIFYRYWWRYGSGVHHVAYTVDNIDETLQKLREYGVETTSEDILQDPVSGLKQIFLAKKHCGYFVELIERNDNVNAGEFVEDNMSALANTMQGYLADSETDTTDVNPSVVISRPIEEVMQTMADPFQLPKWTGHRVIREIGGRLVESRMHGDIDLNISTEDHAICFTWSHGGEQKFVWMHLTEQKQSVNVHVDLSNVPSEEKEKLQSIIQVELDMLAAYIEGEPSRISESERRIIDQWHLEIHQRKGL